MKFVQAQVAPAVRFFAADLRIKFQLEEYHDVTAPAVFFGCYSAPDLELIAAHRGPRLLVWMGSDALNAALVRKAAGLKPCHHVAISSFIATDLASARIAFFRLPVTGKTMGHEFQPSPKGPAVYVYYGNTARANFYGLDKVRELEARFPDLEFICCAQDSHPREKLVEIYQACFLGLRLVPHDGLPNSVVELGLMGRKTVHNGDLPGSLTWRSLEDVSEHIRRERRAVGQTDHALAVATRRAIELPEAWLETAYYRGFSGWRRSRPWLSAR